MYAPRYSPIDSPWLSRDPDAADCMCPDSFREKCIPVEYCPQHGDEPDFSLSHNPELARMWRAAQAGELCVGEVDDCPFDHDHERARMAFAPNASGVDQ